jgi:putative glycosyltransferase
MKLSIVTTIYRTAAFMERLHRECVAAAEGAGFDSIEMIVVIDGSPDDWRTPAMAIKAIDGRVKFIELSRNFGHHAAIWCGLEHASGDFVFLLDSDLEVAPSILGSMRARFDAEPELDAVYAYQEVRGGGPQTRWLGAAFWKIFRLLSSVDTPEHILTERLMRRAYVEALLRLGDRNLFLVGMMAWVGFLQAGVVAAKRARSGRASYSFVRRAALAVDAITSFSERPLKILFVLGTLTACMSFGAAAYLVIRKLVTPAYILHGFTFMAVLILFSLGATLGSVGLLGVYIGKIFNQTRGRPTYLIRRLL